MVLRFYNRKNGMKYEGVMSIFSPVSESHGINMMVLCI